MNDQVTALIRELDESRRAIRRDKEILKEEANPVRRIKRSWAANKAIWIASGAAAVGLVALMVFSRRKKPVVPRGYIVVAPAPKPKPWWTALKFAVAAARPALGVWMKMKAGPGRPNGRMAH
jgi:hypothetical protein